MKGLELSSRETGDPKMVSPLDLGGPGRTLEIGLGPENLGWVLVVCIGIRAEEEYLGLESFSWDLV